MEKSLNCVFEFLWEPCSKDKLSKMLPNIVIQVYTKLHENMLFLQASFTKTTKNS